MLADIILFFFLILLVWGRLRLVNRKYYRKLFFINFIIVNIFTILWYILQYYFLYHDFKMAEPDMSIAVVPELFRELSPPFFLNILYNVLYVILNFFSKQQ